VSQVLTLYTTPGHLPLHGPDRAPAGPPHHRAGLGRIRIAPARRALRPRSLRRLAIWRPTAAGAFRQRFTHATQLVSATGNRVAAHEPHLGVSTPCNDEARCECCDDEKLPTFGDMHRQVHKEQRAGASRSPGQRWMAVSYEPLTARSGSNRPATAGPRSARPARPASCSAPNASRKLASSPLSRRTRSASSALERHVAVLLVAAPPVNLRRAGTR